VRRFIDLHRIDPSDQFQLRTANSALEIQPLTRMPSEERLSHVPFGREGEDLRVFLGAPDAVLKWALGFPSAVNSGPHVFKNLHVGPPAFTMGSIAGHPGLEFRATVAGDEVGIWGSSCIWRPIPWPTNTRTTRIPRLRRSPEWPGDFLQVHAASPRRQWRPGQRPVGDLDEPLSQRVDAPAGDVMAASPW